MIYVHPVIGTIALAALLWLASAGLRSRHRAAYASDARLQHRWLGPWVLALVLFEAGSGTATTWFLREDLDATTSWHFIAGWSAAVLMVVLWTLSRLMARYPVARSAHPVVGLLAVAVGATIGVLGFSLLP